jgi:hypothetical protein
MYQLDHDDVVGKDTSQSFKIKQEQMHISTMRCGPCHRFKSILCGDFISFDYIPKDATVFITKKDNSDDQELIITDEDEVDMLFQ